MRKSFKVILSVVFILAVNISLIAQSKVEYKDVLLDGKPAKLNVATGEITLVKAKTENNVKTPQTDETKKQDTIVKAVDSDFHIVQPNETLLDVSKTYKISLTELKRANNLQTTLIDKGQRLRVKNFDAVTDPTVEVEHKTTYESNSESNHSSIHIVALNETLYSIAKRYNLKVEDLKNQNNLHSNLIKVGQKLRVTDFNTSKEVSDLSVWIVKKGDNLYRIALHSGTTVDEIKRLNGLTSNTIKIGQKLQLK
ncbi:LysM peptidoglycan-binding domain-containing protein [Winogradskyella damuponensis]|uniref:LysM domain-containing protein n=1 Tax=Winogradskyella damuponensis TaxID=943939 RepID=A0ABP8CZM5_9FLAO